MDRRMKLITLGVLLVVVFAGSPSSRAVAVPEVPALFVFGDSLVDVGNNKYLKPTNSGTGDYPPYGIDFPDSKPTGRFSNGYNAADYIAMNLEFKESPPPYLSFNNSRPVPGGVLGANFASGGSGILDETGEDVITMRQQIEYFKLVKRNIKGELGPLHTKILLSKSIFIISAGSNDLVTMLRTGQLPEDFYDTVVSTFEEHLRKLYDLGARKFAIVDVPTVGWTPLIMEICQGPCPSINALASGLNDRIKDLLFNIHETLKGMKYSLCSSYNLLSDVISNPGPLGLVDVTNACCPYNATDRLPDCIEGASPCPDRSKYFFWDGVHPTDTIAKYAGLAFYNGTNYTSPMNVLQLAQSDAGLEASQFFSKAFEK